MRINKGGSSFEYVIPLAVIAVVVGLGIYQLASSGFLAKLFQSTGKGTIEGNKFILNKTSPNSTKMVNNQLFVPGSLNGTKENPQMECKEEKCNIDFGEFVLTGIPAGSSDVSTAGRGSDLTTDYLQLLQQLADQLRNTDPALADVIQKLADQGKKVAAEEKKLEDKTNKTAYYLDQILQNNNNGSARELLKTIDMNNYNPEEDPYKITAALDFKMSIMGKFSNELDPYIRAFENSITENPTKLEDWQRQVIEEQFINDQKFSFLSSLVENVFSNYSEMQLNALKDAVIAHIPEEEINKFKEQDDMFASIKSDGGGPGKVFNEMYTKDIPKINIDPAVRSIIDMASNQIITIADNTKIEQNEEVQRVYIDLFDWGDLFKAQTLPRKEVKISSEVQGQIITDIAPAIIENAKKIEDAPDTVRNNVENYVKKNKK